MAFKLRGIPEWLTSVSKDSKYSDRVYKFSDGTNTFIIKGSEVYKGDSKVADITTTESGSTFTYNNVTYTLERLIAHWNNKTNSATLTYLKSFKDLEKELNKLDSFLKFVGYAYGEDNGSLGRPYLVAIGGSISGVDLNNQSWSGGSSGEDYYLTIPYKTHRKGYIRSNGPDGESSNEGYLPGESKFSEGVFLPRVRTYSLKEGNVYEETYDSPAINIKTGDITVYSTTNDTYLVVIY